jgi:hypothetical protein
VECRPSETKTPIKSSRDNFEIDVRKELADLDVLPFADLEQGVRDDMTLLRDSKTIPDKVSITKWMGL